MRLSFCPGTPPLEAVKPYKAISAVEVTTSKFTAKFKTRRLTNMTPDIDASPT